MEFILNGAVIIDEDTFHDEIARACGFPDYYGANLDALDDCLFDLSRQHPGATIIWTNHKDCFEVKRLSGHLLVMCNSHRLELKA